MIKGIVVSGLALTLLACAKVDMSKLNSSEREMVEYTHQVIDKVGFGGDVALRSIFGKEKVEQKPDYTYYATSFGAKGGAQSVHNEFNKYCQSSGGTVRQTACLINEDPAKIKYYYQLFSSYNKYSGGNTSMLLRMYIPKVIGDESYIAAIRGAGYKTDADLEAEKLAQIKKQENRKTELVAMTKTGTKVCKIGASYVIGWVEGAANDKIQIRLLSGNQVIWDTPGRWKICG